MPTMNNQMAKLWLKSGREVPLMAGHPWIFSKGIERGPVREDGEQQREPGLVEVLAHDSKFLGIGAFNPHTSISVRMLGDGGMEKIETLSVKFLENRFLKLEILKKEFLSSGTTAYRLVNADADWLPGLIVDRYDEVFVFQIHTAGMDLFREQIIEALIKAFQPKAIVERSDIDSRKSDGLQSLPMKIHYGKIDRWGGRDEGLVKFTEHGVKFLADVLGGQKTGFFLDQRDARKKVGELANGKKVLNLFSYTGGFGLYAAINGAAGVTTVDVSERALELAQENFRLNGLDIDSKNGQKKYEFICADVFDYLADTPTCAGSDFDLIVCDPPAFAKSNDKVEQAIKAYTELNRHCMELLRPGGILVTSSCSGRISQDEFKDVIRISAGRAKKDVRVLAQLTQPFDHTERACFPEGRYLKTLVLQCIEY